MLAWSLCHTQSGTGRSSNSRANWKKANRSLTCPHTSGLKSKPGWRRRAARGAPLIPTSSERTPTLHMR